MSKQFPWLPEEVVINLTEPFDDLQIPEKPQYELTDEQENALNRIKENYNMFITGVAGAGKSVVIREAQKRFPGIGLTATTGVAAVNIGGLTIHSWAGLGVHKQTAKNTANSIIMNTEKEKYKNRIKNTKRLIIDEASMLEAGFLDFIDEVFRMVRNDLETPFGGMQIILVGDPLQLPPISKEKDSYGKTIPPKFFFESKAWMQGCFYLIKLTKVFRQKDEMFAAILNRIREGIITADDMNVIGNRNNTYMVDDKAVKIFCDNYSVDKTNNEKLQEVEGEKFLYTKRDYLANYDDIKEEERLALYKDLDSACNAPTEIILKVGARVMMLRNTYIKDNIVNGSCGEVIEISTDSIPVVLFDNGEVKSISREVWELKDGDKIIASRNQLPLRLGYAVTVHKCVSENSLVTTNNEIKKIKDVNIGDLINTGQGNFHKVLNKIPTFNKKTFSVTSKCGYNLNATHDHPILIFSDNKFLYKNTEDLKTGDLLCVDRKEITNHHITPIEFEFVKKIGNKEYKFPEIMSEDLAWVLGLYVGDGSYVKNKKNDGRVELTSQDLIIQTKYTKILEDMNVYVNNKPTKSKANNLITCNKPYREFLLSLGLHYVSCTNKEVPNIIFKCNFKERAAFIRGLFDTDGHCNKHLSLCSVSINLITAVQKILLTLGVISSVSKQKDAYLLSVGGTSYKNFYKNIGFTIDYKQQALIKLAHKKTKTNNDVLPYEFKDLIKKDIITKKPRIYFNQSNKQDVRSGIHYNSLTKNIFRNKNGLTYVNMLNIKNYYKQQNFEVLPILNEVLNKNYFFDKVVTITENENTETVYDIEVDTDHSFWCDGVVVHNCQGATFDSVLIDAEKMYFEAQIYVSLSRVKSIEGLYLRNFQPKKIKVNQKALNFYKMC